MTRKYTGNYDGGNYKDLLGRRENDANKSAASSTSMSIAQMLVKAKQIAKNGGKEKVDKKKQYMELMQNRLQSKKQEMVESGDLGAAGGLSKGVQAMLMKLLEKKAREKAAKAQVKIEPRNLRNGRITMDGTILTQGGRKVGRIDPKKGEIINNMGFRVGKYDPKKFYTITDIERMIDNFRAGNRRPQPSWPEN